MSTTDEPMWSDDVDAEAHATALADIASKGLRLRPGPLRLEGLLLPRAVQAPHGDHGPEVPRTGRQGGIPVTRRESCFSQHTWLMDS